MSIDLSNENGRTLKYSGSMWRGLMILALNNGWEPAGTKLPEHYSEEMRSNWDGNYSLNDLQIVSANDAVNIAHALESALEQPPTEILNSAVALKSIEEFVAFCKEGEFDIC